MPARALPVKPEWLRANPPATARDALGVDRNARVIRGVIAAEEGPFKSEGRGEFDADGISSIVRLMREKPGGLKGRYTHPSLSADGLGTFLGRFRDARTDRALRRPDGSPAREVAIARADLHLDPSAFATPNGDLGTYVMDLAESDPDAFGCSLVLRVEEKYRINEKGERLTDADGDELPPLWYPKVLHALDVVDEGDATHSFLSADLITVDGIPDRVVRLGAQLLDEQFAGQGRDVVRARCLSWLDRYLEHRFGPAPAAPPAGRKEDYRRKLAERGAVVAGLALSRKE